MTLHPESFYFSDIEYEIDPSIIRKIDSANRGYSCTQRECVWTHYKKGEDYGFYLNENGQNITGNNCETCFEKCATDDTCSGVECGSDLQLPDKTWVRSHCSWWSKGRCSEGSELTLDPASVKNYIWTCRKPGIVCSIKSQALDSQLILSSKSNQNH